MPHAVTLTFKNKLQRVVHAGVVVHDSDNGVGHASPPFLLLLDAFPGKERKRYGYCQTGKYAARSAAEGNAASMVFYESEAIESPRPRPWAFSLEAGMPRRESSSSVGGVPLSITRITTRSFSTAPVKDTAGAFAP